VHPVGWAQPYELSLYGRLSAIMGEAKLFPTAPRVQKARQHNGSALYTNEGSANAVPMQTHNPADVIFLGRWRERRAALCGRKSTLQRTPGRRYRNNRKGG